MPFVLPLKTPVGKIGGTTYILQRVQYDVPPKTPLKPNGKNIRRKPCGISKHLYLYVSLKTFYEKPLGKTH